MRSGQEQGDSAEEEDGRVDSIYFDSTVPQLALVFGVGLDYFIAGNHDYRRTGGKSCCAIVVTNA